MRRPALLVAAWLVGGLLAVVLASAAVGRVGNQVTGDRPAPLSAADVRDELAAEAAGTTSTTAAAGAEEPAPPTTATTSTTAPVAATTPGPTEAPAGADETRTYPLVGGTATLRFSPAGVTVVAANPNPGFSVEVEQEGTGLEVAFRSDSHRSKVEAWWDGGPRDSVDEESDVEDD